MPAESEESAADNTYELTCTDCAYEATVNGDVHDALDAANLHQGVHGDTAAEHFVDFELSDRED